MHRWCPSGHVIGPCEEHGRQSSAGCSTTRSPGPRGPNPKAGTVGPKTATIGVPTAVARCSGSESLVTQDRRPRYERGRRSQTQRADRAVRPRRGGGHHVRQRRVLGTADNHDLSIEPRRQVGVARPALRSPDRSGSKGHKARRHAMSAQPCVGGVSVLRREVKAHRRRATGAMGQGEQPLDLVGPRGTRDTARIESRRRAVREADALASSREPRERRGAP